MQYLLEKHSIQGLPNTAPFNKALKALGLDPEASWADTMWDASQKDRGRKAKAGMEDLPHSSKVIANTKSYHFSVTLPA